MTATIHMTAEELSLIRNLVGQEIDSVHVVKLSDAEGATYVRALSSLEGKLAAAS